MSDYVGAVNKIEVFASVTASSILIIKEIGVKYKNKPDEVVIPEEKEVNPKNVWAIPPPPPTGGNSDDSANMTATKPTAAPTVSPTNRLRRLTKRVNLNEASKRFDGSCLDTESYQAIKDVTCENKFEDLLMYFDYSAELNGGVG